MPAFARFPVEGGGEILVNLCNVVHARSDADPARTLLVFVNGEELRVEVGLDSLARVCPPVILDFHL